MTKSKGILGPRAVWTEEQLDMLGKLYPAYSTVDVATMIGHPVGQVYRKAHQLGLAKSEAFLASPASGRLGSGRSAGVAYRFQPGQAPHNTLPIGSTKLDKSGRLLQKVSDAKGNNSKRWRGVHELVWIAANGPLPAKHIVVFKPGMGTNVLEEITPDRVECISLAENMKRNTVHNMPKELVDLVRLRSVLTRSINRRGNEDVTAENY